MKSITGELHCQIPATQSFTFAGNLACYGRHIIATNLITWPFISFSYRSSLWRMTLTNCTAILLLSTVCHTCQDSGFLWLHSSPLTATHHCGRSTDHPHCPTSLWPNHRPPSLSHCANMPIGQDAMKSGNMKSDYFAVVNQQHCCTTSSTHYTRPSVVTDFLPWSSSSWMSVCPSVNYCQLPRTERHPCSGEIAVSSEFQ